MAKALLGYVGSNDVRAHEQTRALRRRVVELEALVASLQADALRAEHAALVADTDEGLRAVPDAAPDYQPA
jgi:hypothetical protein